MTEVCIGFGLDMSPTPVKISNKDDFQEGFSGFCSTTLYIYYEEKITSKHFLQGRPKRGGGKKIKQLE